MNKMETMSRIAALENLLEQAHQLGTELRNEMRALPANNEDEEVIKTGLAWRVASSCEHITTAQTYAKKFYHYANNQLKGGN